MCENSESALRCTRGEIGGKVRRNRSGAEEGAAHRHITHRATRRMRRSVHPPRTFGMTKVRELERGILPGRVEQQVLGLDVPMDDT